jgi:hypothetical protein
MADALHLDLNAGLVLIHNEPTPLASRKEIHSRQKIARNGLQMTQAQPSPRYELMCGRNVDHLGNYSNSHELAFAVW